MTLPWKHSRIVWFYFIFPPRHLPLPPTCPPSSFALPACADTGSLYHWHSYSCRETPIDGVCIFNVPSWLTPRRKVYFSVVGFLPRWLVMSRFYGRFPVGLGSNCYVTREKIGGLLVMWEVLLSSSRSGTNGMLFKYLPQSHIVEWAHSKTF